MVKNVLQIQEQEPVVSVLLIVFNHEKFIEQCLDGIFSQIIDAHLELVIAHDLSTDRTRDVIDRYLVKTQRHDITIKLLHAVNRLGVNGNTLAGLKQCRGEFVALVEGDDYWCKSDKLAQQVSILRSNPDVYLCAHGTDILEAGTGQLKPHEWRKNPFRTCFSVDDYINGQFFHTSSILVRRISKTPEWMNDVLQLDQALVLVHARQNADKIKFIPSPMSVYRIHPGGVTNSNRHRNPRGAITSLVVILARFNEFSGGRYERKVVRRISDVLTMLCFQADRNLGSRAVMLAIKPFVFYRWLQKKIITNTLRRVYHFFYGGKVELIWQSCYPKGKTKAE